MLPAAELALEARRLRVLARRPELNCADRGTRARRALSLHDAPGPLHYLDFALVVGAGPLHLFLARGVRRLARKGARCAGLVALLCELEAEQIVALHYALPARRRPRMLREPVWVRTVADRQEDVVGGGEVWINGNIGSGDGVGSDDDEAIEAADRRIDAEIAAREARQAAAAAQESRRPEPPATR